MERYNSNPEFLKVQSGIFDKMYGFIKDLEVNKSIKFHDLLIFGIDNAGMYLFYYYYYYIKRRAHEPQVVESTVCRNPT